MDALFLGFGLEGAAMGALAFGHLVGLVLGLGTTAYLDGGCFLSIARGSWGGYRSFMAGPLFGVATKFVMVGLGLLWITGCGFLVHYSIFDPGKLSNPKLIAKLAVVTVLTVNGYALHYLVLMRVRHMDACGELLQSRVGPLCLFSGAVSSASWIAAFLLGALPVLNDGLEFAVFVVAWAALVLVLYLAARIAVARAAGREHSATVPQPDAIGLRDLQAILVEPTPAFVSATAAQGGNGTSHRAARPRAPRPSKAAHPA